MPNLDPNSVVIVDSDNVVDDVVLNNGQLVIGRTGSHPVASSLSGTDEIIVTNGPGSITLSTPQPIATSSSPTFQSIYVLGDVHGSNYTRSTDDILSCSTPR